MPKLHPISVERRPNKDQVRPRGSKKQQNERTIWSSDPPKGTYLEAFGTIWGRFWHDNRVGVGNSGFGKIIEKTMVFQWFSVFGECLGARKSSWEVFLGFKLQPK